MAIEFCSVYLDEPIVAGRVVDFFFPAEITRDTALFFVHGGGWRAGARAVFHRLITEYNRYGFACANTDYRLGGVTAAEQISDIRRSYMLFIEKLRERNRPCKILVLGSSAGAHLAALLALAAPGECGDEIAFQGDWVAPCGAALQATPVTFEPWEDIFPAIWTSMQDIAGVPYAEGSAVYRRLSPIAYLKASNPPLFFLEAENEHMFPGSMTLEFVEKHNALGICSKWKEYPRTEHGFFYDMTRWQQREAFEDIKAFAESL
jgi:pectinesterase